ncbi:MAG TPA: phage holin family protein [Patescibacteria group bacterium]|nr:phage holin family protein [Patescibacteria group bacterium]
MKTLLRNIALYSGALFILPFIVGGVEISGGIWTFIFGGIMLSIMMTVIKPVLNVISFPFNLVTLGFFSIFTNAFILYLLTIFVNGILIHPFRFGGANILGFVIPAIGFNTLFAFLAASFVLSFIVTGIKWLIE